MSNEFNVRGDEGLIESQDTQSNTVWLKINTFYRSLINQIPGLSTSNTELHNLISELKNTISELQDRIVQIENSTSSGVTPTDHNQLIGLQGGVVGPPAERYHLSSAERGNVLGIPDIIGNINAILKIVTGGEGAILPPINDISQLPLTCTPGQVIFVRSENMFYSCNGDGQGWSPVVMTVGGGTGGRTTSTFQDIMMGRFM